MKTVVGSYKNSEILKGNNFKKGRHKIEDIVELIEYNYQDKHISKYKVIQVIDKGNFNMYLCENIITKCRRTFSDKDLNIREEKYKEKLRGAIENERET